MSNGTRRYREYGLGNSTPFVTGPPRVAGVTTELGDCPVCGCKTLYDITVTVKHPALTGDGSGVGMYVGCPACPFASPMLMMALEVTDS